MHAVAAACVIASVLMPVTGCGSDDSSAPPQRPPAAERGNDADHRDDGDRGQHREGADEPEPAPTAPGGRQLFVENCGSCHTLAQAGTTGRVGPDLDEHFGSHHPASAAKITRVIQEGPGRMPANRVRGHAARAVADFVVRATRE